MKQPSPPTSGTLLQDTTRMDILVVPEVVRPELSTVIDPWTRMIIDVRVTLPLRGEDRL